MPTRNGGVYLKNCIDSLLSQNSDDFEIIISDNANTDDTCSVLMAYSHINKIKIVRQDSVLNVTDNWNASIHHSSGEYILMMGDDDYLLPGYFQYIGSILDRFNNPDCIIYNGYSYISPKSINQNGNSYYKKNHFQFDSLFEEQAFQLDEKIKNQIVRGMFQFKVRIPLNMQTTLFSRKLFASINNGYFKAPFPDHYLLNAMLLNGASWVYAPKKLVVVGVSPKSFGHYVYSDQQQSGLNYLGVNTNFHGKLPGNELLNGMYQWLIQLKKDFPAELNGVYICYSCYVLRQLYFNVLLYKNNKINLTTLFSFIRKIHFFEWVKLIPLLFSKDAIQKYRLFLPNKDAEIKNLSNLIVAPNINNIKEFSEWIVIHDF